MTRAIRWTFLLMLFLLLGCDPAPGGKEGKDVSAAFIPSAQAIRINNRGVALMGRFEYEAASDAFADLTAKYPNWREARLNLAIAILNRQRQGDEQAALALADQVLIENPTHPRAHYIAGLLRLYLSSPQEAREHFAKVVEADPADAYAAYYLGQCLAQQSEPEQALVQYRRSLDLDPYLRSAAYGAFQALQQLGRRDEAREFVRQYQRLATNPRARLAEFKYTRMGPKAEARAAGVAQPEHAPPRPTGPLFNAPTPLLASSELQTHESLGRPLDMTVADLESDGLPELFVTGVSTERATEGPSALLGHNLLLDLSIIRTEAGRESNPQETDRQADHKRRSSAGALSRGSQDDPHPLTRISSVNGTLWGDFDNDGHIDAYLLRNGQNRLWRNLGNGAWLDVTAASGVGNGALNTIDGLFLDADHDGDLDLFLVNANGPNALLHNNLNGTFRSDPVLGVTKAEATKTSGRTLAILPADLDRDRDTDLIILNRTPPHRVAINDRLWSYHASPDFAAFEAAPALAAAVADLDADGITEIYTIAPDGGLSRWSRNREGVFMAESAPCVPGPGDACLGANPGATQSSQDPTTSVLPTGSPWAQLAVIDIDGDGRFELWVASPAGWSVLRVQNPEPTGSSASDAAPQATPQAIPLFTARLPAGKRLLGITPLLLDPGNGPGLLGLVEDADINGSQGDAPSSGVHPQGARDKITLMHWTPGPGRHPFLALHFTGMSDRGKAMRSNASGIGTRFSARVRNRWTIAQYFGDHSGPGQGHQPIAIGLGGAPSADFIAIDWSDGVLQTEIDLPARQRHLITETQRQLSSCPVLFAWDGDKYRFVTDFLGVGGMGYALGPPGQYNTPRPWENLLLAPGQALPRAGRYRFKLTEPMEEVAYLDALRLVAYDLPSGWRMALDERMGLGDPKPTGAPFFYRRELSPRLVINQQGNPVTDVLRHVDGRAAPLPPLDPRFIGRLAREHILTLNFPRVLRPRDPAGAPPPARRAKKAKALAPILVIDGWVEYPYSQTMFAAWQAGADWQAPSVEALGQDGRWHPVLTRFGYPAGMPRRMSAPLRDLPPGARVLRLRTNQEIYWDRITVAFPEPLPTARRHVLPLVSARLNAVGFPGRVDSSQRHPGFDYARRRPFGDTRPMSGFLTRYGPVEELLTEADNALAIFGAGEEIHVEFTAPDQPPPNGWQRYLVLETQGWTKDRDLFTKDGETVGPLPTIGPAIGPNSGPGSGSVSGKPSTQQTRLHTRYLTRHVGTETP
uniref:Tetratricopeptide (TPR) repeat n=1 Tax=Candidatus Kentrum sp. MB TaxID=2138164 RepID=A0A450XYG0_9GAMM|nr:MAG: Tetratricopeptide (TPR) repeat [Candidatus Kentron sp. MB]VFK34295.1 MAG: Tetratricopeptide (TPR) repeat [Candidatus Kentron sp. MB]VFK76635.1 MAG: Tetratricopeptide (TPR) repeat [Candidatus Kentron sp. MB]